MRILFGVFIMLIFIVLLYVAKYGKFDYEISMIFGILTILGIDKFVTDVWTWIKDNDNTVSKTDGQESELSS